VPTVQLITLLVLTELRNLYII